MCLKVMVSHYCHQIASNLVVGVLIGGRITKGRFLGEGERLDKLRELAEQFSNFAGVSQVVICNGLPSRSAHPYG